MIRTDTSVVVECDHRDDSATAQRCASLLMLPLVGPVEARIAAAARGWAVRPERCPKHRTTTPEGA